ncbi:MAG: SMC-Scp complex subunit ScpB [Phycisphaeraceae bacterium]
MTDTPPPPPPDETPDADADASREGEATTTATLTAPLEPAVLDGRVEAVLMATERAIPAAKISEACQAGGSKPVNEAIDRLNAFYVQHKRSFRIEPVAGGYQILTVPEFGEYVAALHRGRADNRLSPSALETLAIIAYKQPIMRADIEAIRGVACGEVIRSLMERHLVKITGRAEEIGRPMLYGTTKTFLEIFGLANLKDLPKAEELHKP